jgi:hypothetical protein
LKQKMRSKLYVTIKKSKYIYATKRVSMILVGKKIGNHFTLLEMLKRPPLYYFKKTNGILTNIFILKSRISLPLTS